MFFTHAAPRVYSDVFISTIKNTRKYDETSSAHVMMEVMIKKWRAILLVEATLQPTK
jgi:hypothetical protein